MGCLSLTLSAHPEHPASPSGSRTCHLQASGPLMFPHEWGKTPSWLQPALTTSSVQRELLTVSHHCPFPGGPMAGSTSPISKA